MSFVTSSPPVPTLEILTAAGNQIKLPPFPSKRERVEGSRYLDISAVPSATAGNVDHVNGTSSGFTSLVVEKMDSSPITGGKFFLFTGKIKDGATTALVNNLITVSINSVEVGRIYVDADTQTIGWMAFHVPGDREDSRFPLSGTSTTGDLIFSATAADPALELRLFLLAND